jgi:radical SAM protein with 4Fe4S-binding SPASM domain
MPRPINARLRRYFYLAGSYSKSILSNKTFDYPRMIQIQTNSLCNGRCVFCPYSETSKRFEQGTMDIALYEKIVKEAISNPFTTSMLFELHNEPLLDSRIFGLIKYVKDLDSSKECSCVTNGLLLDKFDFKDIKDSRLNRLTISMNAFTREKYEECCGLNYDRIMNNIDLLIKDERLRRKLSLSFVVTEDTASEISQAPKYWKGKNVKTRTLELLNRAGTLSKYEKLKPKSDPINYSFGQKIDKYIISKAVKITGCYEVFHKINILYNGDVILCCHDWNRTTVLGNLKNSSIKEIWNSPRTNEIRKLILKKKYSEIECCRNCSLAT